MRKLVLALVLAICIVAVLALYIYEMSTQHVITEKPQRQAKTNTTLLRLAQLILNSTVYRLDSAYLIKHDGDLYAMFRLENFAKAIKSLSRYVLRNLEKDYLMQILYLVYNYTVYSTGYENIVCRDNVSLRRVLQMHEYRLYIARIEPVRRLVDNITICWGYLAKNNLKVELELLVLVLWRGLEPIWSRAVLLSNLEPNRTYCYTFNIDLRGLVREEDLREIVPIPLIVPILVTVDGKLACSPVTLS